jgi:NhaP-type Na+/H+ or K+/H+ antiporter
VKPQERDELAKSQKLEAIQAELAQHGRTLRLMLLLVTFLSAVVFAVVLYFLLGRA